MNSYVISEKGKVSQKKFSDENLLDELQVFVGGYIEVITFSEEKIAVVVNDEGRLLNLPYTCKLIHGPVIHTIVGNIAIFEILNSDFCSIRKEKAIDFIGKYIRN